MKRQPGFPEPYADLDTAEGKAEFAKMLGDNPLGALVEMDIGRLRSTDQILGDLVVAMASGIRAVMSRLQDLGVWGGDDAEA